MTELEQFVHHLTFDLPLSEEEKSDLREEMLQHLQDHVNELLINGCTIEEATKQAMQSFGHHQKINTQLKRVYFPMFKVCRFIWSVLWTTLVLGCFSYGIMEYYHPGFDNAAPLSSYVLVLMLVTVFALFVEAIYEAIEPKGRFQWVKNPWIFFGVPAVVIGLFMSLSLFLGKSEPTIEWQWADQLVVPMATLPYLLARQLFTLLFTNGQKFREVKQ